jgi:hypothetical protein
VSRLSSGAYEYWGEATNAHGAVSEPSARVAVVVSATVWGLVERHPLIPVAVGLLLFLLIGMGFLVRRVRRRGIQEIGGESGEESVIATPSLQAVHITGEKIQTTSGKIPHATVSSGGVVRLGSFK